MIMSSKGRSFSEKIKSQAPQGYVAAHPFKDTHDLCSGSRSPCVLLHLKQLLTHSNLQSPLPWGLAEDVPSSSGSWGSAVSDGVYDLLLPIPIALACGAGCLGTDLWGGSGVYLLAFGR